MGSHKLNRYVSADAFITDMLLYGKPVELSLVGVFDEQGPGRGSRQDIDLPLHRDGEYSAKLAEKQGGYYTPPVDIDFVGLYCIKSGAAPCFTIIESVETGRLEFDLKRGDGLIFNNKAMLHGRRGLVGDRLLIRMWVKSRDR